jgi:GT2 family glycosyltransferase
MSFSFLILSFNDSEGLEALVHSLVPYVVNGSKVHILDNNSDSIHKEKIQSLEKLSNITVTYMSKNIGFGNGVNFLYFKFIESVKNSSHLVLINQDCILKEINLGRIVSIMEKNDLDLVSPVFLDEDLQLNFEFKRISRVLEVGDDFNLVDFTPAAFWVLRTHVFKELDGFDSRFFLYGEDKNFCDRLLANKGKIAVSIEDKVIHPFKSYFDHRIKSGYLLSVLLHPDMKLKQKCSLVIKDVVRGVLSFNFSAYNKIVYFIILKLLKMPNKIENCGLTQEKFLIDYE